MTKKKILSFEKEDKENQEDRIDLMVKCYSSRKRERERDNHISMILMIIMIKFTELSISIYYVHRNPMGERERERERNNNIEAKKFLIISMNWIIYSLNYLKKRLNIYMMKMMSI